MSERVYNVLFLCTGNSARSVMAETLLNALGRGRFRAFSAGSQPAGQVNPMTLEVLRMAKLPTEGLRSKSWDEFAAPGAPQMDFVFTVCDRAAAEVCPIWPGQPITAHWGFEDPAQFQGTTAEKGAIFQKVFREIQNRVKLFVALPLAGLNRLAIQKEIDQMPPTRAATEAADS